MIQKFQRSYREALAQRRQVSIPNLTKPLFLLAMGTLVYLGVAILIAPENQPGHYFIKERSMVTAMSVIFFGLASVFSGVLFYLSRGRKDFYRIFWLLSMMGFAFFCLDDLFRFHESVGMRLKPTMEVIEGFRSWNDIVVILYGVVALFIMAGFLPELFRYPRVMELMGVAFLFYFIHTFIDSTYKRSDLSAIFEESSKVFCAEYLAVSMFVAILGMKAAEKLQREK